MPASDIREIQEVADALAVSAEQRARDEAERERLLSAERAARTGAEQARRRLEMLASAGAVLSRSLQPHATLEAIASIIVPGLADWCRVDLVDADGRLQRALTHHSDPQRSRFGTELVQRLRASSDTPGSMGWTVATGRSHLAIFESSKEVDAIRDRDLLAFAKAIGLRAYFVVPLVARGRTLGAMAALQAESQRSFSDDDCALLVELAQRAALALDNARLYADAQAARSQAESANRAKDEFLAMLGHELRNPLAALSNAASLLQQDPAANRMGTRAREVIQRQVSHLARLTDDLLDAARALLGKIDLRSEPVDLSRVVSLAIGTLTATGRLGKHRVIVDLDEAWINGDPVRLDQIVCNLLINAVKYTPEGGTITVRTRREGDDSVLIVADDGVGMSPELAARAFELFVQGERGLDRSQGGLGIGLTLVRRLAELHGGQAEVHSDGEGRGSEFTVRFPAAERVERADTPSARRSALPRTVLVVEDNDDARDTLAMLLQSKGHRVASARDGLSGLDIALATDPDVALVDLGLPGIDGYEFARRMRASGGRAYLVALTGYGAQEDRERALEAGFDEHVTKPVGESELDDLLDRSHA